jgi:hypothetical protein
MAAGEFHLNNDAIVINERGELDNGQHRLLAVIKSGVTVRMLVIEHAPAGGFIHYDQGRKRTVGNVLATMGEANANVLASASNRGFNLDTATVYPAHWGAPQIPDLLAWLEANPGLRDSVRVGNGVRRDTHMSAGGAAALHYLFGRDVHPVLADQFWGEIKSGVAPEFTATWAIRARLMKIANNKREKVHIVAVEGMVIQNWFAWIAGRRVERVTVPLLANPKIPRWDQVDPEHVRDRLMDFGVAREDWGRWQDEEIAA